MLPQTLQLLLPLLVTSILRSNYGANFVSVQNFSKWYQPRDISSTLRLNCADSTRITLLNSGDFLLQESWGREWQARVQLPTQAKVLCDCAQPHTEVCDVMSEPSIVPLP